MTGIIAEIFLGVVTFDFGISLGREIKQVFLGVSMREM